jgi:hypothetical protein
MKIHESVTAERVCAAVEDSCTSLESPGFCIDCGEEASGVEPDARAYTCESCACPGVYGAEELLIYLA